MPSGDFDLTKVVTDFKLAESQTTDLFAGVVPVGPGAELLRWLDEFAPVAIGFGSESARSADIITPILAEAKRRAAHTVTVIPGLTRGVDEAKGLSGSVTSS